MSTPDPTQIKIYHIVHLNNLPSILADGRLWSDSVMVYRKGATYIGMSKIKLRRLTQIRLTTYPDLFVGNCVPFYFCPRSVMLYMFHQGNHPEITYTGGQAPIIHLVANLATAVRWAQQDSKRWVFTDSNAGSFCFNEYNNIAQLSNIDWNAVNAQYWMDCRDKKQAEFLIEEQFPWELIECISVYSITQQNQVNQFLRSATHRPPVQVMPSWYY